MLPIGSMWRAKVRISWPELEIVDQVHPIGITRLPQRGTRRTDSFGEARAVTAEGGVEPDPRPPKMSQVHRGRVGRATKLGESAGG